MRQQTPMVRKKSVPTELYILLFVLIMVISFYVSGVFVFEDLSLNTLQQHLADVLMEAWKVRKWYNEKTLPCMGVGLIVYVFLVSYIQYHYRNFQAGIEKGSADWGDPFEITKRRANKDDSLNRILSWNLKIATQGSGAPANNNMLVTGASGSGKTTEVAVPNLLEANANYIVLDVKGDLLRNYGLYLQSKGYKIRSLNMVEPWRSDRYNPFCYIETEEDLIRIVDNLYESLDVEGAATSDDPFWIDGPHLYLQALFYYEWERAKRDPLNPGSLNNIMKYLNEELTPDPIATAGKNQRMVSLLETRMNALPEGHPALRDYRKLKSGAEETVRSIIIIINAKLKLLETEACRFIFSADELDLREFGTGVGGTVEQPSSKKMALFLCVPDNDDQYNFIMSMVYTQALQILIRMADNDFKDRGARLPIPLEFWMDEFYAGARPKDTEKIMGVIRSRNISMIPILQSKAQLDAVFDDNRSKILFDNCAILVFMGAGVGALDTHKWISEMLDNATIDMYTDGKSGLQYSGNYGKEQRALKTPGEIRELDENECIVFIQGERPVVDYKCAPWKRDAKSGPYEEAMDMNRENPNGGFIHPKSAVVDGHTGIYYPISEGEELPLVEVDKEDIPDGAFIINWDDEESFCKIKIPDHRHKEEKYEELFEYMREHPDLRDVSGEG